MVVVRGNIIEQDHRAVKRASTLIQEESLPRGERGKLITVEVSVVSVGKTCAHLQRAVKGTPPGKGGVADDDKVAKQLAFAPLGT
jgi:hypothetical protein